MAPPDLTAALRFQVLFRTFPEENAAATVEAIAQGRLAGCILPWVPLMHGGAEPAVIEAWKQLAAAEPESRLRSDYAGLALVFAELTPHRAEWKRALEGWNVRESQQVLEWQEQAREEARLQTRRDDLRALLEERFGTVPDAVLQRIDAATDVERLKACIRQVIHISSPDELQL
jgi:hypothetical protein